MRPWYSISRFHGEDFGTYSNASSKEYLTESGEKKGLGLDGWAETHRDEDTCKHAKEERE